MRAPEVLGCQNRSLSPVFSTAPGGSVSWLWVHTPSNSCPAKSACRARLQAFAICGCRRSSAPPPPPTPAASPAPVKDHETRLDEWIYHSSFLFPLMLRRAFNAKVWVPLLPRFFASSVTAHPTPNERACKFLLPRRIAVNGCSVDLRSRHLFQPHLLDDVVAKVCRRWRVRLRCLTQRCRWRARSSPSPR